MRLYEVVVVMRQDMSANDFNSMIKMFTDIIEDDQGVIIRKETWGMRSLAYEIQKTRRGYYVMMKVKCAPETIKKMNDFYRIHKDQVIRYQVFSTEDASNAPSWMMRVASEAYTTNA